MIKKIREDLLQKFADANYQQQEGDEFWKGMFTAFSEALDIIDKRTKEGEKWVKLKKKYWKYVKQKRK